MAARSAWSTWVLLLQLGLLLRVDEGQAGLEHTCLLSTRLRGPDPNGMCGSRLSNVVRELCRTIGSGYAGGKKRAGPFMTSVADPVLNGDSQQGTLLLTKRQALSYLQKQRPPFSAPGLYAASLLQKRSRGTKGITCECCYHRCSLGELLQYCN
ncbi:con-Ins Im1-like [Babylonia areolata]|uniref:con-Ins Im1-like n=1 Tax=Babylonia areolata TaxID=304850 RepID=UPI003FD2AB0D